MVQPAEVVGGWNGGRVPEFPISLAFAAESLGRLRPTSHSEIVSSAACIVTTAGEFWKLAYGLGEYHHDSGPEPLSM